MGRSPCCAKEGLNRGAWTAIEDKILTDYVKIYGEGKWRHLPKRAGLKRCGKSCRLRWLNYLRPDIKRGNITRDEEDLIIRLHKLLGNRWSLIAGRLPGRTDNEIKNYWNTNIGKKLKTNGNSETKTSPTSSGSPPSRARRDQDIDSDHPEPRAPQKTTGSCLVRTKATRCTKVIVSREIQPLKAVPCLTTHDEAEKVRCDHDEKIMEALLPPFVDSEGNNLNNIDDENNNTNVELDFMADMEMEGFFSDLLNMDISEPASCFENRVAVEGEDKSNGSITTNEQGGGHQPLSSLAISNDDTHLNKNKNNVYEDSLHESEDFKSMSALMENEFDWL